MLNKNKRNLMKKNRVELYDQMIFELEMDLVASEAAGEEAATDEIKSNIEKLQMARAAVEKL